MLHRFSSDPTARSARSSRSYVVSSPYTGQHSSVWQKAHNQAPGLYLAPQGILKLVFNDKETIQELPDTFAKLEAVAREWSGLPPDSPFTLRVPIEYASGHAAKVMSGPYIYLTNEESYSVVLMSGVSGLYVEILPILISPHLTIPPPMTSLVSSPVSPIDTAPVMGTLGLLSNPSPTFYMPTPHPVFGGNDEYQNFSFYTPSTPPRTPLHIGLPEISPDLGSVPEQRLLPLTSEEKGVGQPDSLFLGLPLRSPLNSKLGPYISEEMAAQPDQQPETPLEAIIDPTMFQSLPLELGRSGDGITPQLAQILNDPVLCRELLKARSSDAQVLLNVFQWLLDETKLDNDLRRRLIVATQRLSTKSNLYPICYELKDIAQDGQEPITGGGFADIYKGLFKGQVVCLKAIRIYQQSQLEHVLKQFSKEVILWGQLSHTNVLPMYGLYHFKSRLCIVTPWMQNGDICQYLRNNPKADRLFLVFDIARGLLYLHNNDIVHGDLKGPNILIDDDGRARLCDFGIASVSDPEIHGWTTQSALSSTGGTARWQAPELFDIDDGDAQNTTFSDMYAFACVCYEIYTGKLPFYELSRDSAIISQVQRSKRPSKPGQDDASWREWGLTESIWSLMDDCWKTEITDRPTAQEANDRLSPLLRHADSRTITGGSVLPPTHFRRSMSVPPDITSIVSLVKICDSIIGVH